MNRDREKRIEIRRTVPSWDNAGLRHRVEGRAIGNVDILGLQRAVVSRDDVPARRKRTSR